MESEFLRQNARAPSCTKTGYTLSSHYKPNQAEFGTEDTRDGTFAAMLWQLLVLEMPPEKGPGVNNTPTHLMLFYVPVCVIRSRWSITCKGRLWKLDRPPCERGDGAVLRPPRTANRGGVSRAVAKGQLRHHPRHEVHPNLLPMLSNVSKPGNPLTL